MSRKTRSEGVMNSFYSTFLEKRQDFIIQDLNNSAVAAALREAVEGLNIEDRPEKELSIEKHYFIKGQLFVKDAILRLANQLEDDEL